MSIEIIIYQLAIIKFIRIHCISMKTGVFIFWKAGRLSTPLSTTWLLQQRHSVTEMFEDADDKFFGQVLANENHVLQQYLPERPSSQYNTRTRTHNKTLITKTTHLND